MTKQHSDIYSRVTQNIITAIEKGAGDWQMPWHQAGSGLNRPNNINTGNHYRGINILNLWVSAQAQGFSTGTWGTYKQWKEKDCQVRKGEKSSLVIFYKTDEIENTDGELETRYIARASYVFNADQVDGYEAPPAPEPENPVEILDNVEQFIKHTSATIKHTGNSAFYRPADDSITMPEQSRFLGSKTSTATEAYYSTLLHELSHWTGAKHRLDRTFGKRFGDNAYAVEELVAELGAAFLCADLGITVEPRQDHAAYLENWLTVLKADKKAIFTAASQAAKAADFLKALQPQTQQEAA
jgi:antirestriction protein ArdC